MNRLLLEAVTRDSLDPADTSIATEGGRVGSDQLESQAKLFRSVLQQKL